MQKNIIWQTLFAWLMRKKSNVCIQCIHRQNILSQKLHHSPALYIINHPKAPLVSSSLVFSSILSLPPINYFQSDSPGQLPLTESDNVEMQFTISLLRSSVSGFIKVCTLPPCKPIFATKTSPSNSTTYPKIYMAFWEHPATPIPFLSMFSGHQISVQPSQSFSNHSCCFLQDFSASLYAKAEL